MITVKVKAQKNPLGELRKLPKRLRMAVLNAHRYAVAELKKIALTETVQKYYLTRGQIKKSMQSTPTGFKVSSARLSLDKYKLMPKKPTKKYTLRGAVKRDSSIAPLGNNAFLLRTSKGYTPVARKTRKRYPLKVLVGPSIAQAVGNDETGEMLQQRAEQLFSQRINEYLMKAGIVK